MKWNVAKACLIGCLLFATAGTTAAQRISKDPHLAYAFPAGCQKGKSCEIVVGGQNLKSATGAHLSGEGVQVEIVKWYRPLTQGENNKLRMRLAIARQKLVNQGRKNPSVQVVAEAAEVTAEELQAMAIFRERSRDPKRQPNDQLAEQLTVKVTVSVDAKPGKRELRLLTATAMSNPMWLKIGKLPEICELEPNDTTPQVVERQLPVVINGQIMPGDADSFSFDAKAGNRMVITAAAREVMPYLADAVPGWFEAVLTLTDSAGREVAYADSFYYRQDPVMYFEVPRDGRYTIQIRDSIYRGREDFVYRITLGEIPFLTSVFPLGVRRDTKTTVELDGWNLSNTKVEIDTRSQGPLRSMRWCWAPQGQGGAVRFPLRVDRLPEMFDREPNDDADAAQPVSKGTIVNGRIDFPGDRDIFYISGQGQLTAEIQARRCGSPLDSMLTLFDSEGNEIAFNDDAEDKSQGLLTHHADSHIVAALPRSGCFLHVTDAQGNGGSEYVYRLYLRGPKPDFQLRVTPASVVARPGSVLPITVHAIRNDDFQSAIEVSLVDPPLGCTLSGGTIPAKADSAKMTLSVLSRSATEPINLKLVGRARQNRDDSAWITRPVLPAENMMQAFIWYHLVPVQDWSVIVNGKPAPKSPFVIATTATRITIPPDGTAALPVRPLKNYIVVSDYGFEVVEPKGVTAEIVGGATSNPRIQLTAAKVEPGTRGNLLIRVFRMTTPKATDTNPQPQPRRFDIGLLPAIPFNVQGAVAKDG